MKHDTKKYPDQLVKQTKGKPQAAPICSKCGAKTGETATDIYLYKCKCPNPDCKKDLVYESPSPIVQFLTVCTCQSEFNCFCRENITENPISFVRNIPEAE